MQTLTAALAGTLFGSGLALSATQGEARSVARSPNLAEWTEVNSTFHYRGHPIHPKLIQLFGGSIADDSEPIITAVDVPASFGTNAYEDSGVVQATPDTVVVKSQVDGETNVFAYRWLGRMVGDHHVLITTDKDNGTLQSETVTIVRFVHGVGYASADGTPFERMLLTVERTYPLGDRTQVLDAQVAYHQVTLKLKSFPDGTVSTLVLQAPGSLGGGRDQ